MKFVTFTHGGSEMPGVLSNDGARVFPLDGWADLVSFIADYETSGRAVAAGLEKAGGGLPLESVRLQAPIPHPPHDIVCAGMNYIGHAKELAEAMGREYTHPVHPTYFIKRVNRAVAPDGDIPSHIGITQKLDYEAELAVVIGRRCKGVPQRDVPGYIFGYTVANDVTARDLQMERGAQWTLGKTLDGSAPLGPWIVSADEFAFPPLLKISSRVNGEPRQDSNTSDFIFGIDYLISELSQGITLEPGDIIMTGTPSGVGIGLTPPQFLRPGDVVECEIEGIGVLINKVN